MKTLQEEMHELPEVNRRRVMAESDEIIAEHISNRTMTTLDELIDELLEESRRRERRRTQQLIAQEMALRFDQPAAATTKGDESTPTSVDTDATDGPAQPHSAQS